MANEQQRDRGNLFENSEKKKPSQPDLNGNCSLDGKPYDIQAWRRDDQLTISFAPPRGDKNTYQNDVFRGVLDAKPPPRGAKDVGATPSWVGDIKGDDASYTVSGFQKQGKSGLYYTLTFERLELIPGAED